MKMFKKMYTVRRNENAYSLDTPLCILHTRTGCIPHLTFETLRYIKAELIPNCYQLPFSTIIDFSDIIKSSHNTAAECFSLPSHSLVFTSHNDNSRPAINGYNTKSSVAFWKIGGKIGMTSQAYMKHIEAIQPDVFEILADGDVEQSDCRKRVLKSMSRSIKFLEECLVYLQNSETLKDRNFMCLLEGGYLIEERKHYVQLLHNKLKEMQAEPFGYVFDLKISEQFIDLKTIKIIDETLDLLPSEKPVAMFGYGHPLTVVSLILHGVSVFDTSYVTKVSERNDAFIYKIPSLKLIDNDGDSLVNVSNYDNFCELLNLKNCCHSCAFIPILKDCDCYTCTHHTRAYIHHLIEAKEMLAQVLLMLHNLHHYLTFFKSLQKFESKKELVLFYNSLLNDNCLSF